MTADPTQRPTFICAPASWNDHAQLTDHPYGRSTRALEFRGGRLRFGGVFEFVGLPAAAAVDDQVGLGTPPTDGVP